MKLTINKKAINHYLLIYLLIVFQESILFNMYSSAIYVFTIVLSGMFLLSRRKLLSSKYMIFVYVLAILLVGVVFISRGSLSIASVLNILSRFLLVLLVYEFDKKHFSERYIKLVAFLAGISLPLFAIQCVNANILKTILPEYVFLERGRYYGTLLFSYSNWHEFRNIGIATEPGRYQIYLTAALYLLLFRTERYNLSFAKQRLYGVLIISALVTAQSVTGYISLLLIILTYILITNKRQNNNKSFIVIAIGIILIYLLLQGSESILYKSFLNKIMNNSGELDLTVSSGGSRIVSILTDFKIALDYPLGAGYEIYQSKWLSYKVGTSYDESSCVGLTGNLAAIGFPATVLVWIFYIYYAKKNSKSFLNRMLLVTLVINTSLAQPLIYYPAFMVLFLVGPGIKYKNTNSYKNERLSKGIV